VTPERWREVKGVVQAALERSPAEDASAPAARILANGIGPALQLAAKPTVSTTAALLVRITGVGRGLLVDHRGTGGNLAVFQTGDVSKARIDRAGKGYFNGGTQSSGADVAEAFAVEGPRAAYGPGDVLVISERTDRTVERSAEPCSALVAGVCATRPGVLLSERAVDASLADLVPLGVVGVLPRG
jgi:trimeric autotransporter adhesin